jgi:hypothetical protein
MWSRKASRWRRRRNQDLARLEERERLGAFEMMKQAIFFILDEDKRKKEELENRRKAEEAIARFSGST